MLCALCLIFRLGFIRPEEIQGLMLQMSNCVNLPPITFCRFCEVRKMQYNKCLSCMSIHLCIPWMLYRFHCNGDNYHHVCDSRTAWLSSYLCIREVSRSGNFLHHLLNGPFHILVPEVFDCSKGAACTGWK